MRENKKSFRLVERGDCLLRSLITVINEDNVSLGVTINTAGIMISGELISGLDYFTYYEKAFPNSYSLSEKGKRVKAILDSYRGIYSQSDQPSNYVHMKNVSFFNSEGEQILKNKGLWWRGRISQVTGFCFGRIKK